MREEESSERSQQQREEVSGPPVRRTQLGKSRRYNTRSSIDTGMHRRLWLCLLSALCVSGKRVQGELSTDASWSYIDRFCFDFVPGASLAREDVDSEYAGQLMLDITGSALAPGTSVALYDDQQESWEHLYSNGSTCLERLARARAVIAVPESGLQATVPIFEHLRPRWWYVAVATCSAISPQQKASSIGQLEFKIGFVNRGNWLRKQFSFDRQGMLQLYAVCAVWSLMWLLIYCGNLVTAVLANPIRLQGAPIFVLGILIIHSSSLLLLLAHYILYTNNGVGLLSARGAGLIGLQALELMLTIFGIAVAKGWDSVSARGICTEPKFWLLGIALILVQIFAYCWHWLVQDPAVIRYVFDTPPGAVLVVLRLVALTWFVSEWRSTARCYDKGSAGQQFYSRFAVVFCVWLMSFLVYVAVALLVSPPYKYKVVTSLVVSTNTMTVSCVAWSVWPRWIELNTDSLGHIRGRSRGDDVSEQTSSVNANEAKGLLGQQDFGVSSRNDVVNT